MSAPLQRGFTAAELTEINQCIKKRDNSPFDGCTFNVNEPVGTDDPKYPRSLQIGVNDQQIEGGADTIASGNKTDPSLQVPMGDSALGAIGTWLGGLVKGGSSAATPATEATVAAAATGAACADGSCSVQ